MTDYLLRLVATRTRVGGTMSAEATTNEMLETPEAPRTDDVLHRVDRVMRNTPVDEQTNPDDYRRALALFLGCAERTLRKRDVNPGATLGTDEQLVLEAVVRTDGTRPTLLVRNDRINPDHPMAGAWRDTLSAVKDSVAPRAAAIGRVEPSYGSPTRFFGTGCLVDASGIVLTNLHVLHAMLKSIPNAIIQTGSSFRVLPGGAYVDFNGEDGTLKKNRFRVVEATPSGIDGPMYERLDIAVLRIEPVDSSSIMPCAIPVVADLAGPTGAMSSFCVIGFPGRPDIPSGMSNGIDWDWVTQTLFGNRFGVKRLAPGIAHKPLGQISEDKRKWVFGHDATTLGGSSGSPVLAWRDKGFDAFGIHFAGATVEKNLAHAFAQSVEPLKKLGVPIRMLG